MSQLTQIIALLYRMQDADVKALEREILDARKRAWAQALSEAARAHGCTKTPHAPRREDLAELKRMSREDAKSIAETWNRDVTRQIERLHAENPRGNRQYYFNRLEAWASQRAQWKNQQIALQTEQTTRFYAQQRFYAMNGLRGQKYIFVGSAPVCRICARLFARGIVTQDFVNRYPCPQHPSCSHEWKPLTSEKLDCRETWVG